MVNTRWMLTLRSQRTVTCLKRDIQANMRSTTQLCFPSCEPLSMLFLAIRCLIPRRDMRNGNVCNHSLCQREAFQGADAPSRASPEWRAEYQQRFQHPAVMDIRPGQQDGQRNSMSISDDVMLRPGLTRSLGFTSSPFLCCNGHTAHTDPAQWMQVSNVR